MRAETAETYAHFLKLATNPQQYDGPVAWSDSRNRPPSIQRAVVRTLPIDMGDMYGRHVLDIGCGAGWLCDAFAKGGAIPVGVDPSAKLISLARKRFPTLDFRHTTFEAFQTSQTFDVIVCIMSIEHFADLQKLFRKIARLLSPGGTVIVMSAAYHRLPQSRKGCKLDIVPGTDYDLAIRINKGDHVMYNLLRTPERITEAAQWAGLAVQNHRTILAGEWPDFDPQTNDPHRPILDTFTFTLLPAGFAKKDPGECPQVLSEASHFHI